MCLPFLWGHLLQSRSRRSGRRGGRRGSADGAGRRSRRRGRWAPGSRRASGTVIVTIPVTVARVRSVPVVIAISVAVIAVAFPATVVAVIRAIVPVAVTVTVVIARRVAIVPVTVIIPSESLVAPISFACPLALLPLLALFALLNASLEVGNALVHQSQKLALEVPAFLILPGTPGTLRDVVEILLEPLDAVPQVRHFPLQLIVLSSPGSILLRVAVEQLRRVLELTLQIRDLRGGAVGLARGTDGGAIDVTRAWLVEAASWSVIGVLVNGGVLTTASSGCRRAEQRALLEFRDWTRVKSGRACAGVILQNILQEVDRRVEVAVGRRNQLRRQLVRNLVAVKTLQFVRRGCIYEE